MSYIAHVVSIAQEDLLPIETEGMRYVRDVQAGNGIGSYACTL